MKKQLIFLSAILILLAGALTFSLIQIIDANEPQETPREYSYTTAICDDENFCQDHVIVCQDSQIVSRTPITGAVIQKPDYWQDPRTKEQINEFCNLS